MSLHVPGSTDPHWYKDAIIYELHVRSFFDSNDDGIGDFRGLIQKLDYIQDLGVNTIWLLPFYPSPLRDDGYDIANYRDVNPSYGSLRDFKQLLKEAHARGLRVFTELVVNHTSDQHPWFQAARRAPAGSNEARLLRVERHRARNTRAPASSSPTRRSPTGPGTRSRGALSGIASSVTNRI